MNKILLLIMLTIPTLCQAGLLGFLGDVSSISSALNSGQQSYSHDDLKKINSYLWWHVERNKKLDGYEFLAEALEKSNKAGHLDTVAQTYYINGQKEKAIEIYETRVLPTARATCKGCDEFYRKIIGLRSDQKIQYSEIYKKQQEKLKHLMQNEKQESTQDKEKPLELSINFAIWGVFIVLILNLLVNIIALFKSK